jgi:4-hydroxybenzoate polyprenyltransferase/phosphoserine phosphatase
MTNKIQSQPLFGPAEQPPINNRDHSGNKTVLPIVVDLDGTLTLTDTLVESLVEAIKRNPWDILRLPGWLIKGRAFFKARLASCSGSIAETLPYRQPLCDFLRDERARGRRIILATAANQTIANSVAEYLDLFDEVLASDATTNLKGASKLKAIRTVVGDQFVYAGDSVSDLPIWKAAKSAVIVGTTPRVSKAVRSVIAVEREFPQSRAELRVWVRALRVHQWSKNLLVFVPLLTAFEFVDTAKLLAAVLGFLSFSLAASATYIVNDISDLHSDRRHSLKRNRPLASAQIPIQTAGGVAAAMLVLALVIATILPIGFLLSLLVYLVLTTAYTWVVKRYVLLDVLVLALLYTVRIIAGSAAVGVITSVWLLAFSVFIFFSLALIKRCAELAAIKLSGGEATSGRDYRIGDLVVLWPMGVGAGLCAVVVFALFVSAVETEGRYETPQLLWLVGVNLTYWLGRLWLKTARGEMHDDPVVFALRDFGSLVTIGAMVVTTLVAHFIRFQ